jgi:hypothetical protein
MELERLNILTCEEHKEQGREKMSNRFLRIMTFSIREFCEKFSQELEQHEIFFVQFNNKVIPEMHTAIEECVESTNGDEENELEILLPFLEKRIEQGFMRILDYSSEKKEKEKLITLFTKELLQIFVQLYNVRDEEYAAYLKKHNKIIPLKERLV